MTTLLFTACLLTPGSPITVDEYGSVRVGTIGNDLRLSGDPDDLTRLAVALLAAANHEKDAA